MWWKTADQDEFPAEDQIVEFTLAVGDNWQEISVDLPVKGNTAIIRIYLPAKERPVELELIELCPARSNKPVRVWNFRLP